MYEHFIIMSSSYIKGTRIAMDYAFKDAIDVDKMKTAIEEIKKQCGESVSFSTHVVSTLEKTWKSVVIYDPFFSDAYKVDSLDKFVALLKADMVLSGLDIARFIISKKICTHLELEKLVYLCYADYLCKYGRRLFEDKIYAFQYGPVVESVYEVFKHKKGRLRKGVKEQIARSRFMVLPDGVERLQSVNDTLKKYGSCKARDLVSITHSKDSPWSMKDCKKEYQEIEDEIIKAYHGNEEKYFEQMYLGEKKYKSKDNAI